MVQVVAPRPAANLMPGSKAAEYFDDMPVTEEGSINMVVGAM
jgi:hypothetical protein